MQITRSEPIARIEVVIDRLAIPELFDRPIRAQNPIGDRGILTTKKELMATDELAGKKKVALSGRMPHGPNPHQLGVGAAAVVDPLRKRRRVSQSGAASL